MSTHVTGLGLAIAIGLTVSSPASAFTLDFKATALPGSVGNIFAYLGPNVPSASFAGEPVDVSLSIANSPEGLYVQHFTMTWSSESYSYPYLTSFSGDGFPNDPFSDPFGFLSTMSLSDTGGSITIFPTDRWISYTDGAFAFTINYSLSSPHAVGSVFTDPAATGGGSIVAAVNQYYDPGIGPYDADSSVSFTLASVSEAPEPSVWAILLLGLGGVGAALRGRRRRLGAIRVLRG